MNVNFYVHNVVCINAYFHKSKSPVNDHRLSGRSNDCHSMNLTLHKLSPSSITTLTAVDESHQFRFKCAAITLDQVLSTEFCNFSWSTPDLMFVVWGRGRSDNNIMSPFACSYRHDVDSLTVIKTS